MGEDRLHAFDAARAFALVLGVALHATMSFFLYVPARDVSRSTALAVVFFAGHLFRLSLFFLIAGFFAHRSLHRRGARGFLADRAKRILLPLAAGWPILAPATIAAALWGISRNVPGAPSSQGAHLPPLLAEGLPLVHLWFLYYLCLFYLAALALRAAFAAWLDRDSSPPEICNL